jgi:acid phosphatase (class A)
LRKELKVLETLSRNSSDKRVDETVAQAVSILPYWTNLLQCTSSSRPATWALVLAAHDIAASVGSHYKLRYMRARPAQVYTKLAPKIATPAHPSYPSGHALQAFLIAQCVVRAAPATERPAGALAARIAENREFIGVHYPSDTQASKSIAAALDGHLKGFEPYEDLHAAAAAEWDGADTASGPVRDLAPHQR